MKKLTIAIAISSALALTACGKSNDADTSQSDSALGQQQATPAMEAGNEILEQTEQAAFEVSDAVNEKAKEIGNTVDKASSGITEDMTKQ